MISNRESIIDKYDQIRSTVFRGRLYICLALLVPVFILANLGQKAQATPSAFVPADWTYQLPADQCFYNSSTNCHYGSPVLVDIDGDNYLDIIAVTNNGHVVAVRRNGSKIWDRDIAPYFGMDPGKHEIHSSPAVADINNDGQLEIVVGTGTRNASVCTQGGVIALNKNGGLLPGWPQLSHDGPVPPSGCRDTVFSTPALGDLDNDGDLEITVASWDMRIYAWHHDGTLLPGFPPSSAHEDRFPTWDGLTGKLADNTWSSPALADLDGDGYLDIVIATGEGNFDSRYGGDSGGWTCPYREPSGHSPGYCGGSLYVFNRFGDLLPGFPRYFLEAIGSTPAIADVNGDGWPEIFVGTGSYYYQYSPDHPTVGLRLYGLDRFGNDLPGWAGGKYIGGGAEASPSIGDISGDAEPEIIMAGLNKKLYAFQVDGSNVSGFPMTPLTYQGQSDLGYYHGANFPLADYDGDGKMEIFVNQGWLVLVIDGNGQHLTSTNHQSDGKPTYSTQGTLFNAPAIGDIDNDGKLELVATNSRVTVWSLPDSSTAVDWGMFKFDAARTGLVSLARLSVTPQELCVFHQVGDTNNAQTDLPLRNLGQVEIDWSASTPSGVWMSPGSGSIDGGEQHVATVNISTQGKPQGVHDLGDISISASTEEGPLLNNPTERPVVLVVGDISHIYLPSVRR